MQNNSGAFVRNEKNALAKNEKGIQFPSLPSPGAASVKFAPNEGSYNFFNPSFLSREEAN